MPYTQAQQFKKVEEILGQYIPDTAQRDDAVREVTDAMDDYLQEQERRIREQVQKEAQKENETNTVFSTHKELQKAIKHITDPYFLEALINQAEGQRRKLQPEFVSETPQG